MKNMQLGDKALLTHLANKKARILKDRQDNWQYIAVPNGDKRRRPVAWIKDSTLQRLLKFGVLVQNGNAYVLTSTPLAEMN